jgi:hypothetical protein
MELMNAPPLDQIASPLTRKRATAKDDPTPAVPGNTASKPRGYRNGSLSNANAMTSFGNSSLH